VTVPRAAEIASATSRLRPPFAVKLISPDAVHKSDIGAVRVGVADADAAAREIADLAALANERELRVEGYLIEEMAPAGRELVIGGTIDPRFGPVIMTGLGGVFVEIFEDVSFRICPIDAIDAEDMLDELKGAVLLGAVRGQAPVDRNAVVAALLGIGGCDGLLMQLAPFIRELDVNPLIVSAHGAVAVDARIVLGEKTHG
jgi:acetyl-CoA synthetase (ADP-forming)